MNFLIAYLVFGVIVTAGLLIFNAKEKHYKGWGSISFALIVLPTWPLWTALLTYGLITHRERKCAWCGNQSKDDEAIKAHILVCPLHPMRKEIEKVKAENERLEEENDRLLDEINRSNSALSEWIQEG